MVNDTSESPTPSLPPQIPIEIVTDEEMALIEAAFAAARSCVASSSSPSSVRSLTILSKRRGDPDGDIEDYKRTEKKNKWIESLFSRFRKRRGLFVTDITSSEWCEKQTEFSLLLGKPKPNKAMKAGSARHAVLEGEEWFEKQTEFSLLLGKPKPNKAMKAGSARHAVLEGEIVRRVKVHIETPEDAWAVKLVNFIAGANQLLFDGLTRELPLICFAEGVWMGGIIDEIRLPADESAQNPILVETKTRSVETFPSEPQQRNARLQLMCYKYLWDSVVADQFPYRRFFDFFSLNPNYILSEDIRRYSPESCFPAQTLEDLVRCYQNTCSSLAPAHDQLLLRYEYQKDQSLIGENEFEYNSSWVTGQIKKSLDFWRGERDASFVTDAERWKCKYCQYATVCDVNSNTQCSPQS